MAISATPRGFRVLIGGQAAVNGIGLDAGQYTHEDMHMYFEAFGAAQTGIYFNDVYIEPKNVTTANDGRFYSFSQQANGRSVKGWCEFVGHVGFGHVTIDGGAEYALRLHPWAVRYDVQVAADAGAYYSTGDSMLKWDPKSDAWANATWTAGRMSFAYDVYSEKDPVTDEEVKVVEVSFIDLASIPPQEWNTDTLKSDCGQAVFSADNLLVFDGKPIAPAAKRWPIASVFPKKAAFQFDQIGLAFEGAYMDEKGIVYAVKGTAQDPLAGTVRLDGVDLAVSICGHKLLVGGRPVASATVSGNRLQWYGHAGNDAGLPSAGFIDFDAARRAVVGGSLPARRVAAPASPKSAPITLTFGDAANKLDIYGLIGMNPFSKTPDGAWQDEIGAKAMDEFYNILLYNMDEKLRKTFLAAAPPDLRAEVRTIAHDGSDVAAFYKDLQVPYLTQALSSSKQDQAKYLNAARAGKRLKRKVAVNEVYKRHADKLYRLFWMEKWKQTADYLDDQQNTDYSAKITKGFAVIQADLESRMAHAIDTDKAERLKNLIKELEDLKAWRNVSTIVRQPEL